MKKFLLLVLFCTAILSKSYATHGAGGELYYCSIGPNTYVVTFVYYRNCGNLINYFPAAAPSTVTLRAQSAFLVSDLSYTLPQLPAPNGIDVTQMCAYTFIPTTTCNSMSPTFEGFQQWIYRDTITLPAASTDWVLSCDISSRAQDITTINNPGGLSLYVEATLDNINAPSDCSPVFSNVPMFYACVNMPVTWNYSASDADGDSLVYSLATARSTVTNVVTAIPYLPPFSPANPLTTSAPGFTIDASAGMVSFTPIANGEGTYVCFRIDEYRNHVLIGSVIRDHMLITTVYNFNLITGHLFADADSNNIQDPGELSIANQRVTEINTGRFAFSRSTGFYSIGLTDTGNFIVSPFPTACYTAAPSSRNVYFPTTQLTDSLNDFAFQPSAPGNDICVTITPFGVFRAGRDAYYAITYDNVGTTTVNNCSVIFFPDNQITYVSSSVAPVSITPDSVVWNIGSLVPFQTGSIFVTVHVNTSVPINTLIDSGVRIEPVANDVNPGCNFSAWRLYTSASYDPNDIIVNENILWTTQFPNPPYLEYIIRFQNTGNDTAFFVNIRNPIDTNMLDINTLEFISSSHAVNMQWMVLEQKMEFSFDNILLPDSNVNEPGSHGFVRYRIQPKSTLIAGDSILNNAAIFFDYNAPVSTNNAVTNIVLPTSANGISAFNILLYPNPAGNALIIRCAKLGDNGEIDIYNLMGEKIIRQQTTNDRQQTVDVSQLPSGIYFVRVKTDKGISTAKFVKE